MVRVFDIVYTGLGALNWLPDLPRWAGVVADLLKPEGFLYLAEFHPLTWMFADEEIEDRARLLSPPRGESFDDDMQGSYADLDVPTRNNARRSSGRTRSRTWSPRCSGRACGWSCCPSTTTPSSPASSTWVEDRDLLPAGVVYREPEGEPRLPLMYSLRARRA